MEQNTIEKELLDEIVNNIEADKNGQLLYVREASGKCLSIVEKYSTGFSDWQRELVFTENSNWLKEKTTKELYDLYLETL